MSSHSSSSGAAAGTDPLIVRVRPNAAYLSFLALGVALIVFGATYGGALGVVLVVCGAVVAVIFGYPVVASTVLRVPVLVVGADGIRLPLMGVQLGWAEIVDVRPSVKIRGRTQTPVLLVVTADPDATLRQVRWWLRRDVRDDMASFGTPVTIGDGSLDHTLAEIRSAVSTHAPRASASDT